MSKSERHYKATYIEHLNWKQAEEALHKDAIIVIPIGAQCKEHGLHLPLNNDWLLAEYLKERLAERLSVVIAPTINYSYYPAMIDYAGTVSLKSETAEAMFIDIVKSFARFGPRRFYFLNTGISTLKPLRGAASALSQEGLIVQFSDLSKLLKECRSTIEEQPGGSHADEIETSMMLVIAPDQVKMGLARPDYHGDHPGPLSRSDEPGKTYSPTGAWGDPTLATKEKGVALISCLIDGITGDIDVLRKSTL